MTTETDVLICGSGSAGLSAACWLARYGVSYRILDKREGPMQMGQADGLQCRTIEIFESWRMAEDVLREGYHVLEDTFWRTDPQGVLRRVNRSIDTEPGLSHQPHLILNQARVNHFLRDSAVKHGGPEVEYGWTVTAVKVDESTAACDPDAHCVSVTAEKDGQPHTFRAKYVLACDGAHSAVRRSLGLSMVGDSTNAVWGVMDVYPQTTFGDMRKKFTMHTPAGALLNIPREGGSLVRLYLELPEGTVAKDVTLDHLHATAQRVFTQYPLSFADTVWWSAYAIGQRLADHFHHSHRVFLTGDACHTHSPKAGQGMNVSLADGYNIGWKLGSVLKGYASPKILDSYVLERRKTGADLIEFDRKFSKAFSAKNAETASDPKWFSEQFIKHARYTTGLTAKYDDSCVTSAARSKCALAKAVAVGERFPSAQVVRFCDARTMQLQHALHADGRWRIVIFAGHGKDALQRITALAHYLGADPDSPVMRYTRYGAALDSLIDPVVVLAGKRIEWEQEDVPFYYWPVTGPWKMRDLHKLYFDDESYSLGHGHAYQAYGVDENVGAVVIVRPDQHVAQISAVDDFEAIAQFFDGFLLEPVAKC